MIINSLKSLPGEAYKGQSSFNNAKSCVFLILEVCVVDKVSE